MLGLQLRCFSGCNVSILCLSAESFEATSLPCLCAHSVPFHCLLPLCVMVAAGTRPVPRACVLEPRTRWTWSVPCWTQSATWGCCFDLPACCFASSLTSCLWLLYQGNDNLCILSQLPNCYNVDAFIGYVFKRWLENKVSTLKFLPIDVSE